jgi:hypothetical protein
VISKKPSRIALKAILLLRKLLKEVKALFEVGEAELARQTLRDLADENAEE